MKLLQICSVISVISLSRCASDAPLVWLISLDGLRYDFMNPVLTPNIWALAQKGVYAPRGIRSQVVTVTSPNHHCIATGLYQQHHGIMENEFYDPVLEEHFDNWNFTKNVTRAERSLLLHWFMMGTPLWRANMQMPGRLSVSLNWPLGDAQYTDAAPPHKFTTWRDYGNYSVWTQEIDRIIDWFTDRQSPANFALYYIAEPDHTLHENDIDGPEVKYTLSQVDRAMGYLIKRLDEEVSLRGKVNLILTADHGHTPVFGKSDVFNISKYVDPTKAIISGPSFFPRYELGVTEDEIYANLTRAQNEGIRIQVWRKDNFPKKYNYKYNRRVGPVMFFPDDHHMNEYRPPADDQPPKTYPLGNHGYLNDIDNMRPFFVAHGPAFKSGYVVPKRYDVENVDLYPLVCKILHLTPDEPGQGGCGPNNGTLAMLGHVLRRDGQHSARRRHVERHAGCSGNKDA